MIYKKVPLDRENKEVFLEVYVAEPIEGLLRDAMLVIPGGGYRVICSEREGEPIAQAFMPYGYNAFVLHYSVASNSDKIFPTQLIEASLAIKHIKDNAEEYGINPERVFACGFSAGGHLCGSLATMWHYDEVYEKIDMPYGYNKLTGAMLIYPVINPESHKHSFDNLLGTESASDEEYRKSSIEKNVDEKSVPVYIMHTASDQLVTVCGSLALAKAYAEKNIKFEMHIYPDGPHGMALANEITRCKNDNYVNEAVAKWVKNADFWAKNLDNK